MFFMQTMTTTGETMTTSEILEKCLALHEEGAKLSADYARAMALLNPSTRIQAMMPIVKARINDIAREFLCLRDMLPIQ